MASRTCPMCLGKVPLAAVVVFSYDITCPHCGRVLELSRPSRVLASIVGLGAGWLAYRFAWTQHWGGSLDWVVPLLTGVLAFGILTPLYLMYSADLVLKPEAPAEPAAAAGSPGSGHSPSGHD